VFSSRITRLTEDSANVGLDRKLRTRADRVRMGLGEGEMEREEIERWVRSTGSGRRQVRLAEDEVDELGSDVGGDAEGTKGAVVATGGKRVRSTSVASSRSQPVAQPRPPRELPASGSAVPSGSGSMQTGDEPDAPPRKKSVHRAFGPSAMTQADQSNCLRVMSRPLLYVGQAETNKERLPESYYSEPGLV
jgi:hypothetical protein